MGLIGRPESRYQRTDDATSGGLVYAAAPTRAASIGQTALCVRTIARHLEIVMSIVAWIIVGFAAVLLVGYHAMLRDTRCRVRDRA